MFLPSTIALSLLVPLSQQVLNVMPVSGRLKDAGVYHVATDTWTRGCTQESFGPKVLYSNLANTGFFGVMAVGCDLVWTDEGRIPSRSGHVNSLADAYRVNGFQIAFLSSAQGVQHGSIAFYEQYASCTDPLAITPVMSLDFAVNNVGTCNGCWLITFDLAGSLLEFELRGDGDGAFDDSSSLDTFGWTLTLRDEGTGGFNGPLLNGDPNNVPYGDGTYYQNSGASSSTGLGTVDEIWVTDGTCYTNGCYWFGGYPGTNIFASFWLVLFGELVDPGHFTQYCTANPNSTGAPADLSGEGTSAAAGDIVLTSQPVPAQASVFFHGATQSQIPFGNGYLCATDNIRRGTIVIGGSTGCGALCASYVYDNSDAEHALGPFVGATRNFQHWYRDPMGGGASFNTSNAVSATIPP